MKHNQTEVKAMCVFIRDNKDILVGLGYDDVKDEHFGRVIGGGVELQEKAEDAVRREIKEELNSEIDNLVFIQVIENIFTYKGARGHQIIFLYQGNLTDKSLYQKEKISVIDTTNFTATWLPLKDIFAGKVRLYPKFDLKALLKI